MEVTKKTESVYKGMSKHLYMDIISKIHKSDVFSNECLKELQQFYKDIKTETLTNIIGQECIKLMKTSNYKSKIDKIYALYCEHKEKQHDTMVMVNIAKQFHIAPTIVAKIILKQLYVDETSQNVDKRNFNTLLRDTTLIEDKQVAKEVYFCTLYDNHYSPQADILKYAIGQEYEIKLQRYLNNLGVLYKDEDCLRKYGYDKTPDIKLEIPVIYNDIIIYWIESKAVFADEESHKLYIKDQFSCYWNRFGPGLVIYWFGFLETIIDPTEKRFIVLNDVPEQLITSDQISEEN